MIESRKKIPFFQRVFTAIDMGTRVVTAPAVATGAVAGHELVRHLTDNIPSAEAQGNCVVSVRVDGDRSSRIEFISATNPSVRLVKQLDTTAAWPFRLPVVTADTAINGYPASSWIVGKEGETAPRSLVYYTCNTGVGNPNIQPFQRVVSQPTSTPKPQETLTQAQIRGTMGIIDTLATPTSVTRPSSESAPRAAAPESNISDGRVINILTPLPKPADRIATPDVLVRAPTSTQWHPEATIIPQPTAPVINIRIGPDTFVSEEAETTFTTPTLTVPQVKATADAKVNTELAELEARKEEEQKAQLIREAEEKVRVARANATVTAATILTATAQPTSTPEPTSTLQPTQKPSETPTSVPTATIRPRGTPFTEQVKTSVKENWTKLGNNVSYLIDEIADIGTIAIGTGSFIWLLKKGGGAYLRYQGEKKEREIAKKEATPETFPNEQPKKTPSPQIDIPLRKSPQVNNEEELELLLTDEGKIRLPKDTVRLSDEIDSQTWAAIAKGEKVPGPLTDKYIDQYAIKELLGCGSFSSVYRVDDRQLRVERAMKILRPELYTNANLVNQFAYEARILNVLDHPNIVKLYDAQTGFSLTDTSAFKYMVTEYVDGKPLHAVFGRQNRRAEAAQALDILTQTAAAIRYAHEQGIIHSDLHPDNIMLRKDGQVKVVDFGSAHNPLWTELNNRHNATAQTYTAPEVLRGEKPSKKSDIYSLGVIAFELITGQYPFESAQRNRQALEAALKDTSTSRFASSEDIIRALSSDKTQRPGTLLKQG